MVRAVTIAKYTGRVFGHWTVLEYADGRHPQTRFLCCCVCGVERSVLLYSLLSGGSKSCGCQANCKTLEEKFWTYVNKTGSCWVWTGGKLRDYGCFHNRKGSNLAHRFSWELHFGPIPEEMLVLHKCDNPPCVNPEHLRLGTQADNVRDMISKGREVYASKLNGVKVIEIRKIASELRPKKSAAYVYALLAERYEVSADTVSRVVNKTRWQHITG